MPVGEIPRRLVEIDALKDRPVVLVCRTDKRSATAATLLRDVGFRDVGVLRGGMERWNQKGLPVERRADLVHTQDDRRACRSGLDAGTGIIPNLGRDE